MSQIAIKSGYLESALQRVRQANTPPELRAERRSFTPRPTTIPSDKTSINIQKIELHQTPAAENYLPAVELPNAKSLPQVLSRIRGLAIGRDDIQALISESIKEIGVTANV